VGRRLMLAFAGVTVVFGLAIGVGINRLAAFNAGMSEVSGPMLEKVEIVDAWLLAIAETNRHTRNMLIYEDKARIREEIEAVQDLAKKRAECAAKMETLVRSNEGKALLRVVTETGSALAPIEAEYLREVETGDIKAAKDTMTARVRPAELLVFAALQKLAEHQSASIHEHSNELASSYRTALGIVIASTLGAILIAVTLAWLISRAIRHPLIHAVEVLGQIENGDYTGTITVSSNDEIGATLSGLERMQKALKERTDREHAASERERAASERGSAAASENASIRTALDRVAVGVMLADPDGKIIYLNDAVHALFRLRTPEIRKQAPQFNPETILGSSFDIFHRNPAHQRNVLAGLTGAHTADIKIGEATLRAVFSPVMDAGGKRVGTVVQWLDRTQEVAVEQEVQSTVAKAIDGDLMVRIMEEGKEGFFKSLAVGVNKLMANMAEVVRSMANAAAEVRMGAEEISRGNLDLSQRTEEQASSLEETASSMEQMTATVKNNADNAAQANQLASAAREQAERGGSVVGAAVSAMGEINASSKRIADIIGVIDDIAFQTNLLALNAAVEAARAGEQGRGFAVVASEVRNLASRSAAAAKEIKTLIQDSVDKVAEGTKLVDESGKVLGEIVVRVKKVTDVMAEIASSSGEQASGIEQVNKAITMMDDVTQQNAALVEQASAAAQALTEQAASLTQLIARYRVGDGAPQEPAAGASRAQAAPPPGAVERRSANRPMSAKRRTQATGGAGTASARGASPRAAASGTVAAADEWKEF